MIERGIALLTYNRSKQLGEFIESTMSNAPNKCRIVLCDDGSTDETYYVVSQFSNLVYIRGDNRGVGYNKNRALFALQDCAFIALIEDDLFPIRANWFEEYQKAATITGIHHFCRVQDKEVEESVPSFTTFMNENKLNPIYGPSPRGDLTFITNKVVRVIGGFNPKFVGVGYAHVEWSQRIALAGLISHPNKWVDFVETRDSFVQKGDTEGGRWRENKADVKQQLKVNRAIQKKLKATRYIHHPLVLA